MTKYHRACHADNHGDGWRESLTGASQRERSIKSTERQMGNNSTHLDPEATVTTTKNKLTVLDALYISTVHCKCVI